MSIQLFSPAKINRTLHIGQLSQIHNKHELVSIMQKISLCDVIEIQESLLPKRTHQKNFDFFLVVSGKFAKGVPNDEKNVVIQVLDVFYRKHAKSIKNSGKSPVKYEISLEKNIPNKAGLGGGSSNAAEILKFLHQKYLVPLIAEEYVDLGSDIPFFLENFSTGLLEGVGEKISTYDYGIHERDSEGLECGVLIFPEHIKISTKWAFAQFSEYIQNLKNSDSQKKYNNDFTDVLCEKIPEMSEIYTSLDEFFVKSSGEKNNNTQSSEYGISGSGSTFFVLFSNAALREVFLESFKERCRVEVELEKCNVL